MEIERKYLIEKEQLPADLASYPFHKIEQGYLRQTVLLSPRHVI